MLRWITNFVALRSDSSRGLHHLAKNDLALALMYLVVSLLEALCAAFTWSVSSLVLIYLAGVSPLARSSLSLQPSCV
ncbi:hypothetical protein SISSUDRAFT_1040349 [Sistotremastrum suecicum HHB10207 ss-3]|uniref:Uncharacterized protein n=1 Tax=Sistotremastrum suecicum HHB10207 ss-3 TaxID=1314776 RepID=A0A166I3G2_9AGAM|nr:hypothetical protein SISSUDRAFT_1040349 [Sistotremastrum suecicum HHB10207 ss-3]